MDEFVTRAFSAGKITPSEFGMLTKEAQTEYRASGLEVSLNAPSLFKADENPLQRLTIAGKASGGMITRSEFENMLPSDQMQFVKIGGTVVN